VLLDRTPVAEAESRVRLSEERFTRLFDASPTGFMLEALEDGVLRFDAFNPSIESIFGIRAADWVGRPHRELFSSDRTIPIVAACVDVARDGGLRRWPAEPVDSLPGKRFFDIVAFQIEPNVVAVAVSDVTNNIREHQELLEHRDHLEDLVSKRTQELEDAYESLEAVNESLREATAAKDQFVASMNHELRTPLNSIIGFSSIMLDGLAGEINEEQQRQLQMIRSSGRQLLSLVGNVLDFAKIEHEGGGVDIARIVPGSLVLRVSEMVRPLAEDKGLELIADVSRAPKEMWTDERKLEQALVNLLSNAIKYTEKGSVTIELESCGDDGVRFSVGDTGVGIPADQLDYVFQEFAQIPQRGAGRPQGSGLGLAITKRLVDSLKGEISLSSETGRGSTFVIHLPLAYPIEIE
jgi:signal transduction histidine kinase